MSVIIELKFNREPKLLSKKIVGFFGLLNNATKSGVKRLRITQDLLSLVTSLAHYLKYLIRLALTGALQLVYDFFK